MFFYLLSCIFYRTILHYPSDKQAKTMPWLLIIPLSTEQILNSAKHFDALYKPPAAPLQHRAEKN